MPLLAVRGNGPAGAYGFGAASAKAAAMTAIASTTLGSSTSTVTFSSIPSTYDDLYLVMHIDGAVTYGAQPRLRLNNTTTASSYSHTVMFGDGSSATTYRYPTGSGSYMEIVPGTASGSSYYTMSVACHILNYANTSYNKTVLARSANDKVGQGEASLAVGLFHSTSAVNRLDIVCGSLQTFDSGSVFALYGIKKAA